MPTNPNKMTLKSQLLRRIKEDGDWICGGTLQRWEFRHKKGTLYLPSTISRGLRKLHEEMPHRIDRKIEGKTVFYKYIKSPEELYHEMYQNQSTA